MEDIQKEFAKFDLVTWNEEEDERLESLSIAKLRGKGAPKKKRTAEGDFQPPPPPGRDRMSTRCYKDSLDGMLTGGKIASKKGKKKKR